MVFPFFYSLKGRFNSFFFVLCSSLSQYNIVNNTTRCWMGYLPSSPSASVVLEYLEIPRAYLHDVE